MSNLNKKLLAELPEDVQEQIKLNIINRNGKQLESPADLLSEVFVDINLDLQHVI